MTLLVDAGPLVAVADEREPRRAQIDLGLADLSLVLLAHKLDTRRILTFDERHFRAVRPLQGGAFTLLPADLSEQPGD